MIHEPDIEVLAGASAPHDRELFLKREALLLGLNPSFAHLALKLLTVALR
jgi:hypothetical protein